MNDGLNLQNFDSMKKYLEATEADSLISPDTSEEENRLRAVCNSSQGHIDTLFHNILFEGAAPAAFTMIDEESVANIHKVKGDLIKRINCNITSDNREAVAKNLMKAYLIAEKQNIPDTQIALKEIYKELFMSKTAALINETLEQAKPESGLTEVRKARKALYTLSRQLKSKKAPELKLCKQAYKQALEAEKALTSSIDRTKDRTTLKNEAILAAKSALADAGAGDSEGAKLGLNEANLIRAELRKDKNGSDDDIAAVSNAVREARDALADLVRANQPSPELIEQVKATISGEHTLEGGISRSTIPTVTTELSKEVRTRLEKAKEEIGAAEKKQDLQAIILIRKELFKLVRETESTGTKEVTTVWRQASKAEERVKEAILKQNEKNSGAKAT